MSKAVTLKAKCFFIMIGIYKITNPIGQVYIGQSINIKSRFYSYKRCLAKTQRKLHDSFLKFGVNNHLFETIEECCIIELNRSESKWINYYSSLDLLNCQNGSMKDYKKKSRAIKNYTIPTRYLIAERKRIEKALPYFFDKKGNLKLKPV